MNLDLDTLYSEAGAGVWSSGKKRFYDNRVKEITTGSEGGKFTVRARVVGERDYHTALVFDEQGGLYDYDCDCGLFAAQDGPCKHIVAAALAYENKYPSTPSVPSQTSSKARTDAAARSLVSDYGKRKHTRRLQSGEEKVRLIPELSIDGDDRLSLTFTIGRGRQYNLKDLSEFVSCMQTGAYRRYGVELELVHVPENFDEKSRALVAFLLASYREKSDFAEDFTLPEAYRDELKLLSGDVDEFMKLYEGEAVRWEETADRSGVRLIVPGVDTLAVALKIDRSPGGFAMTLDLPRFRCVAGKQNRYLVTNGRIYRLSEEYTRSLMPLFKTFGSFGRLFVAEEDMAVFYNNVLTEVMSRIEVDAGAIDLGVFEAAPFVARLYLNPDGSGGLAAELKCSYDDVPVDVLDDGAVTGMVRDWETENAFKALLQKYFPHYPALTLTGEGDVYTFMQAGIGELFNYAELYLAESVKRMKVKKPPRIKVGVRLESGLLDVDLSAEGFDRADLVRILQAYREKRSYIRLADGSFVDLIDPSIGALSEILEVAETKDGKVRLPQFYAPFLDNELKAGFFSLERSVDFKSLIKALTGAVDSEIPVPDALKDVMRNYQKTGFRWLKTLSQFRFGGILADDMGLGKSLQVISLLLSDRGGTSLIVCPTTLILNWVNEFTKFAPQLRILPVMGTYEERRSLVRSANNSDVVVTSYELLRRDDDLYQGFQFNYAVIDEAQYIKNPDTKNARAVKRLRAEHRFALTGTPVENSLAELWSIFDFIMPGYLYAYPAFKEKFELDIVRGNEGATSRLQKLVRPFILRRLKSGVLKELPPKVESTVVSLLEGEQRNLYAANLSLIKDSVTASGQEVNKVVVLSMLTRLRQICCEPRLVYPDYAGNSAKLDMCLELTGAAAESGHKVLIFSQFTTMLDVIRARLSQMGITYYLLKGDTPKAERMKLVGKFNADDTQVFLISLKAGGTGLNLTGADVVIHYDPWWNESVMNQATDRAYRLGQDKSVQVYKLILGDTIEQKILKLQEKKSALSGLIVGARGAISYDEILEILE